LEEAEEGTEAVSPLSGVLVNSDESTGRGCGGSVRSMVTVYTHAIHAALIL
jgi:hypothetical protein